MVVELPEARADDLIRSEQACISARLRAAGISTTYAHRYRTRCATFLTWDALRILRIVSGASIVDLDKKRKKQFQSSLPKKSKTNKFTVEGPSGTICPFEFYIIFIK